MRKSIQALALALLLSVCAYAGEMQNGAPAPPPQSATAEEEQTTDGDIQNGVADIFYDVALNLLSIF